MFAIIETGGKQYRVEPGKRIKVELLKQNIGAEVSLERVLLHSDDKDLSFGTPFLEGASVTARVLAHVKSSKIRIFKLKRRKHSKKQQGHRQNYTEIEIEKIQKYRSV